MASTLSLPLMSVVDPLSGRGHGHSHSHQGHGNRRGPTRAALPRIPSERLDPRSTNFEAHRKNDTSVEPDGNTNGAVRQHIGAASLDHFVFPARGALALSATGDLSIPKRVEAPLSDLQDVHTHYAHATHHSHSDHKPQETDYGPGMEESSFQQTALAGFLLSLPFLATSIFLEDSGLSNSPITLAQSLFLTLTLTSVTLVLFGLYGLYQSPSTLSASEKPLDIRLVRANIGQTVSQSLAVALPYFTLLQLDSSTWSFMTICLVASGLLPGLQDRFDLHYLRGWKTLARQECWALGAVALLFVNAAWSTCCLSSAVLGLLGLATSVFLLDPPYGIDTAPGLRGSDPSQSLLLEPKQASAAAMIDSKPKSLMTLGSGVLALILAVIVHGLSASTTIPHVTSLLGPALATVCSYLFTEVGIARSSMVSLSAGLTTTVLGSLQAFTLQKLGSSLATAVLVFVFVVVGKRASAAFIRARSNPHVPTPPSVVTVFLLKQTEDYALFHGILINRKSRHIFYFLLLNFAFMGVQTTYGFLTGSLGLLGDSVHMFFDCVALMLGISAAVMSKWPPTIQFPYGYGKIDTLAGLGNGVLLVLISIELLYESAERLLKDHKIERENDLLSISVLGLLVNIVGVFAFHSTDDHSPSPDTKNPDAAVSDPETPPTAHISANMRGIYLHILADLVSSVSVIASTALIKQTGWSGWDAIGSTIIAGLITWSAIPLITASGEQLLLALPSDVEYQMRDTLAGISTVRGVAGYKAPKFWLDDTEKRGGCHHGHSHGGHSHGGHSHGSHSHGHGHGHAHHSHSHDHDHDHDHHHDHDSASATTSANSPPVHGSVHVQATKGAQLDDVQRRVLEHLAARNVLVTVHVEREGELKCWCTAY